MDDGRIEQIRASYDAVAERYAEEFGDELAGKPVDRALYALFAELVQAPDSEAAVADVGCGPGHVTGHLAALGLEVVGVDASPGMISVARRSHPGLRFEVGTFAALPASDGEWAGAVAPYSIIHRPACLGVVGTPGHPGLPLPRPGRGCHGPCRRRIHAGQPHRSRTVARRRTSKPPQLPARPTRPDLAGR